LTVTSSHGCLDTKSDVIIIARGRDERYPDYSNVDRSFSQTYFARLSSLTLIYLCVPHAPPTPPLAAAVNYEKNLLYLSISTLLIEMLDFISVPVPMAIRSNAWVCDRSPAEIMGSNPAGGMDVCLLLILCVVR